MTRATDVLIHRREFDIGLGDEEVDGGCRHIQESVLAAAVAIVEIITKTQLPTGVDEIAHLGIASPVIEGFVDLLTFGKSDMHIVSFCPYIPSVFQHGKLHTSTEVVG